MKSKIKLGLPVVILLAFAGLSGLLVNSRETPEKIAVEPPILLVDIATAYRQPVEFSISSQGTVGPRTQTNLMAEASGQIIEVSEAFVSGGFFNTGDVLVRIDPRNYQSAVKKSRASVAKAETLLAKESALGGYAKEDYNRLLKLKPGTGPASALTLRKPQLLEAVAELGLCTVEDISLHTGINNRSIQSTMPFFVRTQRLVRIGWGHHDIRQYRIPHGE